MGLPLKIDSSEAERLITVFCAQAFWRDRNKLARGQFREFKTDRQAIDAAESMARRNAGAVVFSITGNPDADYWQEPKLLASFGSVPELTV